MTQPSTGGATPAEWAARFGDDPATRFDAGAGGLTRVRIDHSEARGLAPHLGGGERIVGAA